ncbi:class II fructose-bisphosphatase [Bdellovibrio sp. SKB1291214]|uniref:class II fructose-bisphosphatase n=1 Tax=Bdellovibrio sp. SKB1291214 TaxID=1732569 RepID=UPI000B514ECD|nr:class II fructose-bisphosphatase [Bdellovibrio sp. SKB1291214]UYL08050.1 class II fructose-bisphosphatase [Bdellovibrio sp. SKB1291214]
MDRNLALEFVRVTEAAALESARWMGRGDEKAADAAAVDAMRKAFDVLRMDGTVVIGEGERDEAPMLYIGEKVGTKTDDAPALDIALDPLEGTTICATGGPGSISVIAVAEKGKFLHAPDTYMDKIACGPGAKGKIDIDKTPTENVEAVAKALGKKVSDMTVVILNRPRHKELIDEVRKTGARIQLIGDGDVSAAVSAAWPDSGIDLLIGIGGAPEGVISAAAMQCLGGDFQGRLKWRNDEEKARASKMGLKDLDKKFTCDELASGSVMFVATGITDGSLLKGVRFLPDGKAKSHSIVMRSQTGTIRTIESFHDFTWKKNKKS